MKKATTPCVGICRMDKYDRYCIGCKRSRIEIARWSALTEESRKSIVAELKERQNVPLS